MALIRAVEVFEVVMVFSTESAMPKRTSSPSMFPPGCEALAAVV